jgi:hypothetical protein
MFVTDINWQGSRVKDRVRRANEDILMDFAQEVMIIAKSIVHVLSGTLMRSIKADRPSEVRDRTQAAESRDLGHPLPRPEKRGNQIALAVGGTTFYAIYEELLHPYMEPALQAATGEMASIIQKNKF